MARRLKRELFERLPKTDLHVHLDGSLRAETIVELAQREGVSLPAKDAAGIKTALRGYAGAGELETYLRAFEITLSVLQTEEGLYRAAYELAQDAAAENVRYMEVRYSPMLHTSKGLRHTQVVEIVLRGLRDAELAYGIESRLIICGIRNISPAHSLEMAELTVAYKARGVVGFDLAGAEADNPPQAHTDAFMLVRRNNINVTIHAGEAYGPSSIAQALHVCGAHRVGHGCRLREDGDLLHYVIDHRVPLECCPSSNVQTGAVASLATHPIKLYANLGARVTVNTDNRLITDTTVTRELELLHTELGFRLDELKQVIINGFKSAFLPFHQKRRMLAQVNDALAEFDEESFLEGDDESQAEADA